MRVPEDPKENKENKENKANKDLKDLQVCLPSRITSGSAGIRMRNGDNRNLGRREWGYLLQNLLLRISGMNVK